MSSRRITEAVVAVLHENTRDALNRLCKFDYNIQGALYERSCSEYKHTPVPFWTA